MNTSKPSKDALRKKPKKPKEVVEPKVKRTLKTAVSSLKPKKQKDVQQTSNVLDKKEGSSKQLSTAEASSSTSMSLSTAEAFSTTMPLSTAEDFSTTVPLSTAEDVSTTVPLSTAEAVLTGEGSSTPKAEETSKQQLIITLTDETFNKEVESKLPTLVMFHTDWCTSCVLMKSAFTKAAAELNAEGFPCQFGEIDCMENPETMDQYEVDVLPLFYLFEGGKIVGGYVGRLTPEQLKKIVKKEKLDLEEEDDRKRP